MSGASIALQGTFLLYYIGLGAPPWAQLPRFDPVEATIASIHSVLLSRRASCRDVIEAYRARIEEWDPLINAIITLNDNALATADRLDNKLARGESLGELFCVPTLLKDNFDTRDMPTTGGCLALRDSRPSEDAPVVRALMDVGSIILGKTNMHEMALEGLTISSFGGQTLNPYDLTRTPGGSSGGTGAALAASFAVLGTGTDTMNSLRSPASANGLFGIRPTRDLLCKDGVIPVSSTQDMVGPMARTVEDLAAALTVMARAMCQGDAHKMADELGLKTYVDYGSMLGLETLHGKRFGLVRASLTHSSDNETEPVLEAMDAIVSSLQKAGASVIPIHNSAFNSTKILASCDTQRFEYREQLNYYLRQPSLKGNKPASFEDIYGSRDYLVIPRQYDLIQLALNSCTSDTAYAERLQNIRALQHLVEAIFTENVLDAFIYPQQSNLVVKVGSPFQSARNGILAAVTGYPAISMPIGYSNPTKEAPVGVPIGMEILGLKWTEEKLLSLAKQIAGLVAPRVPPQMTHKGDSGSARLQLSMHFPPPYPIGTIE